MLTSRAKQEYGIDIDFESVQYVTARWLRAKDERDLRAFIEVHGASVVRDRDGQPAFLPTSPWELDYEMRNNEGIEFLKTKELD